MTILFNFILRAKIYPRAWKIANVILIPKPGKDPELMNSDRPISLLQVLSKIFERLLLNRIMTILSEKHVIPQYKFGFKKLHSTFDQAHRIVQEIGRTLQEKHFHSDVFLDLSLAFDKVWHEGLFYKLKLIMPESLYLILCSLLMIHTSWRMTQIQKLHQVISNNTYFSYKSGSLPGG